MKPQATRTKAVTLGPFLTLILLSSPGRIKAVHPKLQRDVMEDSTYSDGGDATQDDVFSLTLPQPPPRITPGPFLSLILTLGQGQPHSERETEGPLAPGSALLSRSLA